MSFNCHYDLLTWGWEGGNCTLSSLGEVHAYLLKKPVKVGMRVWIQSNLKQWNEDVSQDLLKAVDNFLGFVNVTVVILLYQCKTS